MQRRTVGLAVLTVAGLLGLLLIGVVLLPRLLYPPLSPAELQAVPTAKERIELQQVQSELQNNARTPLLQGLGGLLLVAGVIATWQQVLISREGQITERFTRAIDQLGSNKVDIRLGGIFALERIAKNSKADRSTIIEVLSAFVRTHAPWPAGSQEHDPAAAVDEHLPWLRDRAPDVQAVLRVLGRDPLGQDADPHLAQVDLRHAHLSGAQMRRAYFVRANLSRSAMRETHLEDADMRGADLRQAVIDGGFLSRAKLENAHLEGASLRSARLEQAMLVGAQLQQTDLRHANLSQVDLRQASLRHADLRGTDLRNARLDDTDLAEACADATTVWPEGFNAERRRSLGVIIDTRATPDVSPGSGAT